MDSQTVQDDLQDKGRKAKQHPAVHLLARAGLVAYGLVYVVLGWLAFQVAIEDREAAIDKTGALRQVAQQPLGEVALWAAAIGLAALALWQGLEALVGDQGSDLKEKLETRGRSIFRMAVFAFIAYSAVKTALGETDRKSTDGYTAKLMHQPFGPWLVGAVGVAIIAFAIGSAVIGLTDRYKHSLDVEGRTGDVGKALEVLARLGYCSRAIAFGIMGSLFLWAAFTHDAQKSGGLDQALGRLLKAPLGPTLLVVVAAGFACYGLFNIAKAKHMRA